MEPGTENQLGKKKEKGENNNRNNKIMMAAKENCLFAVSPILS